MQAPDEKWTQRGGGVFTDDEEDMNHQKDSPEREEVCPAGSFGHRLSRFNRQASKTPVAMTGHSCSEEKGKAGDEERSAATDSGRKACSESSFVSDSRSKAYSQNSPGGSDNNNVAAGSPYVGRRRRFRKPFNAVGSSTMPLQESNATFPPPPPGFVHRGSSRGSSVRSPGKFHTGQRINGPYGRKPHVAGHVAAVPRHTSVPPGCHKTRSPAKASIPGFPISRTVLKSHLPSVKNLCLMGSAVSDVVEIATDNTIEVKCSISELARVLNGYNYVSEKFELKGIHFEIPMADAFSQVDKTLWADCELVVHNCDFRALSADACATLLGQFTSKNIHLVGVVELPEPCQDLLERPTFKAAYCLKFSRNESGTAPAVKIDPEKLAQWLHSGGEVPRYVMLQSRQVSNLYDAIATFRKEHQQTKAQSQYLVDIYTANCPQEYRIHTIQELEYASRQRINIRYDSFNNRMILKRYSTDRIDAKSFELQIRTFAGVPVPDHRAGARRRRGYRGRSRIVSPKKKHQVPEHVDAIERLQRLTLNDVSVVDEQASDGRSASSIVPLAERALSVPWSPREADHKEEFMGCVSFYIGRIFDMLHARGQGQATMQFKQRLVELFADMERSVSSDTFAGVPVPDRRAGARRRRGYRGRGHRAGRGRIVAPKKKYQMPRDA